MVQLCCVRPLCGMSGSSIPALMTLESLRTPCHLSRKPFAFHVRLPTIIQFFTASGNTATLGEYLVYICERPAPYALPCVVLLMPSP
jgi:hypothetical protein